MNFEEIKNKTNLVTGYCVTVPVFKRTKIINETTKVEEEVIEDGEEVVKLRPIIIDDYAELEHLNIFELDYPLVAHTLRKPLEWVKKTLNPICFDELLEKCEEINKSFFARQPRLLAKLTKNAERDMKVTEIAIKNQESKKRLNDQNTSNPLANASLT